MHVQRFPILRPSHIFVRISLVFLHLIQDHLHLHLAGSKSWTFVHNRIMTDPQDVFLPGQRESNFLDLP
jgi:hypothetical protein